MTKKERHSLPNYETPSMVTYKAEDILEEIAISSYNCSGGADHDGGGDDGWYNIFF